MPILFREITLYSVEYGPVYEDMAPTDTFIDIENMANLQQVELKSSISVCLGNMHIFSTECVFTEGVGNHLSSMMQKEYGVAPIPLAPNL